MTKTSNLNNGTALRKRNDDNSGMIIFVSMMAFLGAVVPQIAGTTGVWILCGLVTLVCLLLPVLFCPCFLPIVCTSIAVTLLPILMGWLLFGPEAPSEPENTLIDKKGEEMLHCTENGSYSFAWGFFFGFASLLALLVLTDFKPPRRT